MNPLQISESTITVGENTAEQPAINLRLGDAFAGLASLTDQSCDVTITDPPFDTRTHRACLESSRAQKGKRRIDEALPFPPLDDAQIELAASELARVTRRWILVFCAERQIETWATSLEQAGARYVRLGFALRTNPRPQMSGDRPGTAGDPIVIAHAGSSGKMRWNGGGSPARWMTPPTHREQGGQVHPTQKSLSLMETLVASFSDPSELVLDPFAGAGTTAVAARQTGRRFIGWEIDPGYHELAMRRIENAREQLCLEMG